ncbi:hypothetical protein cym2001_29550 [Pseudomonas sp. CYM-20-01]|uniref:hypothetical protein n=1 Tax=Pseudomonas sp. CYM-20-01 TaxID=2870750 RepID=UPI00205035C0|nr:hypothetical protein [Pseudomonas sp. CYM-20-01]BDB19590.1 hypothetical protein cym2001_29550 [Pseudomonas sp. CYM-20-01]
MSSQEVKYPSFENRSRKIAITLVAFALLGGWIVYMLWASRIGLRTVLMPSIPEWTTYIAIGCVVGLVFACRGVLRGGGGRTLKSAMDAFFGWFCVGFACSIQGYDVAAYLLPGDTIHYESAYEISFPGPVLGKLSRCEAGVWIKDVTTERWIQLCTNKADLNDQIQRGMTAVRVTAHANKIGSYIVGYQFIYQ